MILVDANLLLYARFSSFEQHETARHWLDGHLNANRGVGLPWESLLAFARLASNPRMFPRPLTVDRAWHQVTEWLAQPGVWTPGPTDRHGQTMSTLVVGRGLTSKLVMDAHLAAIAMDHGLVLCSADRDFKRFDGLRYENPVG